MKVTGYKLQQAIKEQVSRRELAESRFEGSLKKFPDEAKPDPRKLMEEYQDAEKRIAALQTAQAEYNLKVQVEVEGEKMSLLEAVKQIGGFQRVEKKWRSAAAEETDRYGGSTRDRDALVAQRQVPTDACVELAKTVAKRVRALRYAIQKGDAVELDMKVELGLD
jgi:hypothetical protein